MKGVVTILLTVCIGVLGSCNPSEGKENQEKAGSGMITSEVAPAVIAFDTLVNNLGELQEGERVISYFNYRNTGRSPLIIKSIEAGCGCTVPYWDKQPLEPGDSSAIKVIFDSGDKSGYQNILITVYSNAHNSRENLHLISNVKSSKF